MSQAPAQDTRQWHHSTSQQAVSHVDAPFEASFPVYTGTFSLQVLGSGSGGHPTARSEVRPFECTCCLELQYSRHTCLHPAEDVRKLHEDSIAGVLQPVMRVEEVEIARALVGSDCDGNSKEVPAVGARPTGGCCKLHSGSILSLKFVLLFGQECEVSNVIQNDAIVHPSVKAAHGFRKDLEASHFQFERLLEEGLDPLCIPSM